MPYVRTALAIVGLAALMWLGIRIEAAGYDRALADQLRAQTEREVTIAKGFTKAVADAERKRQKALDELDKLRRRPPVVITDVQTEIIERNVCRRFDREFIGLLDAT